MQMLVGGYRGRIQRVEMDRLVGENELLNAPQTVGAVIAIGEIVVLDKIAGAIGRDRVVRRLAAEVGGVDTGASGQRVVTGPAGQLVVGVAPGQGVIARIAGDRDNNGCAGGRQHVGPGVAEGGFDRRRSKIDRGSRGRRQDEYVVAGTAIDGIRRVGEQNIVTDPARHVVRPGVAGNHVVAGATRQDVIAVPTEQRHTVTGRCGS